MKKHTKIYFNYFQYSVMEFIPCEICLKKAVDIHHIQPKGMGGSKTKDYIENLMALCREHHIDAHAEKISKVELKKIHLKFIDNYK